MAEPALQNDSVAMQEAEHWRSVVGYEGLYEVSSLGRVRSMGLSTEGVRLLSLGSDVYRKVMLYRDGRRVTARVAHLVAMAFLGPRTKGLMVLHNDGDTANNRASNLRYGTHLENMKDRERHGTAYRGEEHDRTSLSAKDVRIIRRLSGHLAQSKIADAYGLTQSTVSKIILRQTWRHIS